MENTNKNIVTDTVAKNAVKLNRFLLAGFGGQGILFAGKQLAYAGMHADKEVSWLPSYGPEMRGGTANCSVIIDDEPIGSPLVNKPDVLLALNLPSYDKFIGSVVPGGLVILDSSLIKVTCERTDVTVSYVPATKLASENNLEGLANVIILGNLIRMTGVFDINYFENSLISAIPPKKAHLIPFNKQALYLGYEYDGTKK